MPGAPNAARAVAVPAGSVSVEASLPAGGRLLDALAALLVARRLESACLTLSGGGFGPFAYVMPAPSTDAAYAAFYSETFRPAGLTRLKTAAVTVGFRDGRPFIHCHGLWRLADGQAGCGHILPEETVIGAAMAAQGAGIVGAQFEVTYDAETNFRLFMPRATATRPPPGAREAVAFRLAPNQDLISALERVGTKAGFRRAALQGGVASIIGARFIDAPGLSGFATELLVRRGEVRCADGGGPETRIDSVVVDIHGSIGAGCLEAGFNAILITCEGLLEAV